jgi:hypothetical protein
LADTSGKERDEAGVLDSRLMPIAVLVSSGQVIERHWEFFKGTYFPGMSDEAAQTALLAWAERNGITASLRLSVHNASGATRVSHVRLVKSD